MAINENINLHEDYVSFETAKLLKEKGFNERICHWYDDEEFLHKNTGLYLCNSTELDGCITAPTLQMAMKWLREVHKLHCHSDYDIVVGWYCEITSLTETVEYDYEEMKHYCPYTGHSFSSPEEACEAAIKYCLKNLI